jgi:hypothetical protein
LKNKIFIAISFIVYLTCCNNIITERQVSDIIKRDFALSDTDKFEILGISRESSSILIVDIKEEDKSVKLKLRKYDKGWKVDEVQNELGMWVPMPAGKKVLEAQESAKKEEKNKENQKYTMRDITTITTALADYIIDHGKAPEHMGPIETNDDLISTLSPFYVKSLPTKDSWGYPYYVYCGKACNGVYGLSDRDDDDILVFSFGSDGDKDDWAYQELQAESGMYTYNDFSNDLVMYNGSWIRAPEKRN